MSSQSKISTLNLNSTYPDLIYFFNVWESSPPLPPSDLIAPVCLTPPINSWNWVGILVVKQVSSWIPAYHRPHVTINFFSVCRCGMSAESSGGESFLWWRGGGQRPEERRSVRDEEHQQSAQLWKRVRLNPTQVAFACNTRMRHQSYFLQMSEEPFGAPTRSPWQQEMLQLEWTNDRKAWGKKNNWKRKGGGHWIEFMNLSVLLLNNALKRLLATSTSSLSSLHKFNGAK